jgi:hypothetical protein
VRLRRQELHLVGDDLERVAPDAVLTSPTAAVKAAADVDESALGEMLSSDLSEAAPGDDVVELQLVSPVVDDPEGRNGGAVGRVPELRVLGQATNERDPVEGWSAAAWCRRSVGGCRGGGVGGCVREKPSGPML